MKKNIAVIALVIVLIGVAIYQSRDDARKKAALPVEQAAEVNFIAPHFNLTGIDGESYVVDGERDKALLLNFWASWCEPCHIEAPDLVDLYEKYHDKLDIYAVNVTEWDTVSGAMGFIEQYDFAFPVMLDEADEVSPLYKIRSYPTNLLINKDGVVIERYDHLLRETEIKAIERHLRKM